MLDNPLIGKSSDHLAIWVYLLLNASHEDTVVIFDGQEMTLRAGELLTSARAIEKALKIDHVKVHRILKEFGGVSKSVMKSETLIETVTDKQKTLVVIRNWGVYQMQSETPNVTQSETQVKHESKSFPNSPNKSFPPIPPFQNITSLYSSKREQELRSNITTTTNIGADDKLKLQFVTVGNADCGGSAELFITNNQVAKLKQDLNSEELAYYLNRMDELILEGYTFTCSHYEYIMRMVNQDRAVIQGE